MNAKLCKRLRKMTRASVGKNAQRAEYLQTQVHKKACGFNTLADGKIVPLLADVCTLVLKEGCFMYRYRLLKARSKGVRHVH